MNEPKVDVWVPQLFYDLIGGVVPGGIILFLGFCLLQDPQSIKSSIEFLFKDSGVPSTLIFLLLVAVSYAIGVLLGHTVPSVKDDEWRKDPKTMRVELPNPDDPDSGISYIYDAIQHHYPTTGARLAKLSAERCFARVFTLGNTVLVFLFVIRHWAGHWPLEFYFVLGILVSAVVAAFVFDKHIQIRSRHLLLNNWHILQSEGKAYENGQVTPGNAGCILAHRPGVPELRR